MVEISSWLTSTKETLSTVWDRFRPNMVHPHTTSQVEPIAVDLPYEDFIDLEDRTFILMQDGSLGYAWELNPVCHEVMRASELIESVNRLTRVIEKINDKDITVQIIMDSEIFPYFELPDYAKNPKTLAERILVERIKMLQENGLNAQDRDLPLMRRKFYVTLKVPRDDLFGMKGKDKTKSITASVEEQIDALESLVKKTIVHISNFEETVFNRIHNMSDLKPLSKDEFLILVRDVLNSKKLKIESPRIHNTPYNHKYALREQITQEYILRTPGHIQVGEGDTWEVLSWRYQPAEIFHGMMAPLLKIQEPLRVVVNIRPNLNSERKNIEQKENRLRYGFTARDIKQKEDVRGTLDRLERGESLVGLSLHILFRNEGQLLSGMKKSSASFYLINTLERELGITFIKENFAGAAIFDLCLPLGYHPSAYNFTGREEVTLSQGISPYFPILGGFSGHKSKVQLMQARSGDPCWISTRSGQLNPHIAVVGSSGGGKSFLTANFITAQLASDPHTNVFIIDNKTSYTMIARALSKSSDQSKIIYPPKDFPNIFLGNIIENDRLVIIVSIIKNAVRLCDPKVHLSLEHDMIISESIKEAYYHSLSLAEEHKLKYSKDDQDNLIYELPRLDDIIFNFGQICTKLGYHQDHAQYLKNKLLPFSASGPYGHIFNQKTTSDVDHGMTQINIYDMDGVSGDPVMRILATQICISDIFRMIKHPTNIGKKGLFVIDEAGVLLKSDDNPELVSFVEEAWRTFRKLHIHCLGITNSINDYKRYPALKTIWNISPNKFILPMISGDIDDARRLEPGDTHALFTEDDELIVRSLTKVDGKFSQIYFKAEDLGKGTFIYTPTGYDYWLSVSKREEIATCEAVKIKKGSYEQAIEALAQFAPFGFHKIENGRRETRVILEDELRKI